MSTINTASLTQSNIMRIAILGATSQIAKDLVLSFTAHTTLDLPSIKQKIESFLVLAPVSIA